MEGKISQLRLTHWFSARAQINFSCSTRRSPSCRAECTAEWRAEKQKSRALFLSITLCTLSLNNSSRASSISTAKLCIINIPICYSRIDDCRLDHRPERSESLTCEAVVSPRPEVRDSERWRWWRDIRSKVRWCCKSARSNTGRRGKTTTRNGRIIRSYQKKNICTKKKLYTHGRQKL